MAEQCGCQQVRPSVSENSATSTVRSVGKGRWEGREGIDEADRKDMKDAEVKKKKQLSPRIATEISLKYSIFLDVIWLTSFPVLPRGPSTNTS